MSKQHGQFFGHPLLAAQLAKRVRRHFTTGRAHSESSLVVGVFGEWGSGKSNLLHLVDAAMQEPVSDPDNSSEQAVIITVAFNPWRYEKEEHLIVPLLKTVQMVMARRLRQDKKLSTKIAEALDRGMGFVGNAAVAFATAFSGKLVLGGHQLSFSGKDLAEGFDKAKVAQETQQDEGLLSGVSDLDSLYFEFQHHLAEITAADVDSPGFRLLFLIDDLDRCLPEKAVEMLESIKLFLDVEGCAFVLALDDEVVERGIVHRYRDYLFQRDQNGVAEQDALAHLPITGAEYLEKIVQLPFRLPSPTRRDIRRFLCQREPELFGEWDTALREPGRENILLDLFAECIPPVPRKLIRAIEMLKLLLDVLEARRVVQQYDLLPLAKLTLLQLFAPDLYRYGRRYDSGFMTRLEQWVELDYWGMDDFTRRHECKLLQLDYQHVENVEQREVSLNQLDSTQKNDLKLFRNQHVRLYQYFQVAEHNRSGFDPDKLVRTGSVKDVKLTPYFRFLEDVHPEVKLQPEPDELTEELVEVVRSIVPEDEALLRPEEKVVARPKVVQPVSIPKDPRPVVHIRQPKVFLEQLFSGNAANWQSALQTDELEGRVLPDELFETLLANLTGTDASYRVFAAKPDWWRALDEVISDRQFARAVSALDAFRLADAEMWPAVSEACLDDWEPVGLWLVGLNPVRKGLFNDVLKPVRDWALSVVENGRLEPKQRARAGDLLGQVGDPRFHGEELFCLPKLHRGEEEENLGFVKIEAGPFLMGASKRRSVTAAIGDFFSEKSSDLVPDPDAQDNETVHQVTLTEDYYLARYPVTVAQYACFLRERDEAEIPEQWDEQLLYPNHPVVYVSWEDARAYCDWLMQQLQEAGQLDKQKKITLPTEAQWEKAARSGDQRIYPWGNQWDSGKANTAGNIGHPSVVGMYPEQHPQQLHDLAGNVFEWVHDIYGEYPEQPVQDPAGASSGAYRVIRGGSWYGAPGLVRSAGRNWYTPDDRDYDVGFRLAQGQSQ